MGTASRVQKLKWLSLLGAVAAGLYETSELDKAWRYLNRYYPETSEYQKTLEREAKMAFQNRERVDLDEDNIIGSRSKYLYDQMYHLPLNPTMNPDQDPNSVEKVEKY